MMVHIEFTIDEFWFIMMTIGLWVFIIIDIVLVILKIMVWVSQRRLRDDVDKVVDGYYTKYDE